MLRLQYPLQLRQPVPAKWRQPLGGRPDGGDDRLNVRDVVENPRSRDFILVVRRSSSLTLTRFPGGRRLRKRQVDCRRRCGRARRGWPAASAFNSTDRNSD